jgi:hypothetical protein
MICASVLPTLAPERVAMGGAEMSTRSTVPFENRKVMPAAPAAGDARKHA